MLFSIVHRKIRLHALFRLNNNKFVYFDNVEKVEIEDGYVKIMLGSGDMIVYTQKRITSFAVGDIVEKFLEIIRKEDPNALIYI